MQKNVVQQTKLQFSSQHMRWVGRPTSAEKGNMPTTSEKTRNKVAEAKPTSANKMNTQTLTIASRMGEAQGSRALQLINSQPRTHKHNL